MEGTSQPCKMARQGVSTAREERRDMGVKEGRVDSKKLVMGGFQFLKNRGWIFWMRCGCMGYPNFPIKRAVAAGSEKSKSVCCDSGE